VQKIYDGGIVRRGKFISVTPRMLRALADKLEEMSKDLTVNEASICEITTDIYGYYEPSLDRPESPMVKTAAPSIRDL
jgi:hypothetical protein